MKLGEPYEDGGKWYRPVLLQEDEPAAKSLLGLEMRGTSGHGDGVWRALPEETLWMFRGFEYRIPADPYHGITLPEPPAGYRLAKWGEEWDNADRNVLFWSASERWIEWQLSLGEVCYDKKSASSSIFAIPIDLPDRQQPQREIVNQIDNQPLKSWQFREAPWVVPEPNTLADCVEERDAFCCFTDKRRSGSVLFRRGSMAFYRWGDGSEEPSFAAPDNWKFVRYIDPPPQRPLSLDDVPDGRCLQVGEDSPTSFLVLYWKAGNTWWISDVRTGEIKPAYAPCEKWTTTNYIAEFRGPA